MKSTFPLACLPTLLARALGLILFLGGPVLSAVADITVNDTRVVTAVADPADNEWNFAHQFVYVGSGPNETGLLFVEPGGQLLFHQLELGFDSPTAEGYLVIYGPEAEARSETHHPLYSDVIVGRQGYGEIHIANGGKLFSREVWLGRARTAEGRVVLVGPDSTWTSPGGWDIRIGHLGKGSLELHGGATFGGQTRQQQFRDIYIGNVNEESGGVISHAGNGTVLVADGSLFANRGFIRIGNRPETVGHVTVRGRNSVFSVGTFLHVGSGGAGSLLVEGGGSVTTGSEDRFNAAVSIGAATRVGESVMEPGASGNVRVTGRGSSMDVTTFLNVGRFGEGTLTIDGGGVVRTGEDLRIGREATGKGTVTVSGRDSLLRVADFIQVGTHGQGSLFVVNEARVEALDFTFSVAREPGSEGRLVVSGGGEVEVSRIFYAGREGRGIVDINSGGRILAETNIYIGREQTGDGTLTVSGTGSLLEGGSVLRMGTTLENLASGGAASLAIRNGGLVRAGGAWLRGTANSLSLDQGTLDLNGQAIHVLDTTLVTGNGTIHGDMVIGPEAVVDGGIDGGILLTGRLSGAGMVRNAILGGVDADSSGPLHLRGVDFLPNEETATVRGTILGQADYLFSHDEETDFSQAAIEIVFGLPLPPSSSLVFPIFANGTPANPASVSTPGDWVLNEHGVLHHVSNDSPALPFSYTHWAAANLLHGADASLSANPSGDGIANLTKFLFGLNPNHAQGGVIESETEDGLLRLRWNRSTRPGAEYRIEKNTTLDPEGWLVAEGIEPRVIHDAETFVPVGFERVEWETEISGERAFFRVLSTADPAILP